MKYLLLIFISPTAFLPILIHATFALYRVHAQIFEKYQMRSYSAILISSFSLEPARHLPWIFLQARPALTLEISHAYLDPHPKQYMEIDFSSDIYLHIVIFPGLLMYVKSLEDFIQLLDIFVPDLLSTVILPQNISRNWSLSPAATISLPLKDSTSSSSKSSCPSPALVCAGRHPACRSHLPVIFISRCTAFIFLFIFSPAGISSCAPHLPFAVPRPCSSQPWRYCSQPRARRAPSSSLCKRPVPRSSPSLSPLFDGRRPCSFFCAARLLSLFPALGLAIFTAVVGRTSLCRCSPWSRAIAQLIRLELCAPSRATSSVRACPCSQFFRT
jgi:hypothetical protein